MDMFFESLEAQDLSGIKSNLNSIEKDGCPKKSGAGPQKSAPNIKGIN
jgi:hypothetical protein